MRSRTEVVQRAEAERELAKLAPEQLDALETLYPGDDWAFGRKACWKYQEAVRRGWLLGPA